MKQYFLDIRVIIGLKFVEIGIAILPDGLLQNHLIVGLHNGVADTLKEKSDD